MTRTGRTLATQDPGTGGPSRRRLLVLSFHFPPDGSVGGLRWHALSKYLARLGWEVHVVTGSDPGEEPVESGVKVHYAPPRKTLNDGYNALRIRMASGPRFRGEASTTTKSRGGPRSRPGAWRQLRHMLAELLVLPDAHRGWIGPAAARAHALLEHHAFDAVVSSGPPHSAHLAAVHATRGRPEPVCLDFRDPWVGSKSAAAQFLQHRLEARVLRRADHVIANTSLLAEEMRERYSGLRVVHVSNGIDPERLPNVSKELFPGLVLSHVGTLYIGRDPWPILAAMRSLLADRPELAPELSFRLAGDLTPAHAARLKEQVGETGLDANVETLGLLTRPEALTLVGRSHLAVVLAQSQRVQVPAKLYECIALGIPTLVITEPDSATAIEAERLGATVKSGEDVEGIRRVIEGARAGRRDAPASGGRALEYSGIARRLSTILAEISDEARLSTSRR